MAKSRAQRKAERRAKEEAERKQQGLSDSAAQHDTQVPKSGDIAEIEAVEAGIAAGAPEEALETPDAPKQSKIASREEKRKKNLEAVCRGMALADEVGALCCVDIAGSFNAEQWDASHPDNLSQKALDLTVENIRHILDSVKP